ncbi:hypothetical protein FOPG_17065 [Fusarium oxysporum f. sp. conglutinans race 2 54008]|uniref:Uncharacterized protein n=1 Tax=Fusarium oxysporum f. sp. conglutinans race 2 54008 TaxID=1089457 RepID=X0H470_FUSOX|nr:hypothetical protein FOPG_17065 [Fusarium oxysporum f. sp. conglutinans race 2 54008]
MQAAETRIQGPINVKHPCALVQVQSTFNPPAADILRGGNIGMSLCAVAAVAIDNPA